ncbi:hypothetical protein Q31a_21700 [Aureliella helgolandensis]|uniref:Uncharacterized protein n=1 Tax=Aureliella helgolandensis TaxID=2527968 RepID=A0A518G5J1_9BACT|nr:hypothetical protein Q31a_21700 [Aureliella helgolandensis]
MGEERIAKFAIEICPDCLDRHAERRKEFKAALRKIPEIDNVFPEYPRFRVHAVN